MAADPDARALEANLEGALKKFSHDLQSTKTDELQKFNQLINREALPPTQSAYFSSPVRNGLLSKQLFSYPQRVAVPDEIIHKTITRNAVLITGRPNINIYPLHPATEDVKITGLFLIYSDAPKNTGGVLPLTSSQAKPSNDFQLLLKTAREITQELNIELKLIKVRQGVDSHMRNIPIEINQKSVKNLSNMARAQKNLGSSLAEKLQRILIFIEDINSNKSAAFNIDILELLRDFFHLPSGELDGKKLYQTLSDPLLYAELTSQIQNLMQLSDTHGQFRGLTGQEVLKRTAQWDIFVLDNMFNWNERLKFYNNTTEFRAQINPSMQGIYVGDGSDLAQQKARKISLAYLSLLKLGNRTLRIKLLGAFQSHAEINEQKIFIPLDDRAAQKFGQLIHQLEDNAAFFQKGAQNLSQFFNTLADDTAGYYQLRMGEHILTIAKRLGDDKKINWYVYDANFGEIRITTPDIQKTSETMRLLLHDYFTRLKNTYQKDGPVVFDVYQLNSDKVFKSQSFEKLKTFISTFEDSSSPLLSGIKPLKAQNNKVSQRFLKLSRRVGMLSEANQGLSWIQSLACLSHYWRRRFDEEFMESEKQALDFQMKLVLSGLAYDVASVFLAFGFRQLGVRIIHKLSAEPLIWVSSRMRRLQYKSGLTVPRYGGAF